jgi:hypothetical protein
MTSRLSSRIGVHDRVDGHGGLGEGRELPDSSLQVLGGLGHALAEDLIEVLELPGVGLLLVAQSLLRQARRDTSPQEHGVEGLGDVVVRPHVQALHHAVDLVDGGDHDDGHVAKPLVGFHALEHPVAVEPGHQDIEEHEVVVGGLQHHQSLLAVLRHLGPVAILLEATRQDVARRLGVIDDEHTGGGAHA